MLYYIAKHAPGFLDITTGTNSVFSSVACCKAAPGCDEATEVGSPNADPIAQQLHY